MEGTIKIKISKNENGDTCFEGENRLYHVSFADKIALLAEIMKSLKIDPYAVAICAPIIQKTIDDSEGMTIDLDAIEKYAKNDDDS